MPQMEPFARVMAPELLLHMDAELLIRLLVAGEEMTTAGAGKDGSPLLFPVSKQINPLIAS